MSCCDLYSLSCLLNFLNGRLPFVEELLLRLYVQVCLLSDAFLDLPFQHHFWRAAWFRVWPSLLYHAWTVHQALRLPSMRCSGWEDRSPTQSLAKTSFRGACIPFMPTDLAYDDCSPQSPTVESLVNTRQRRCPVGPRTVFGDLASWIAATCRSRSIVRPPSAYP